MSLRECLMRHHLCSGLVQEAKRDVSRRKKETREREKEGGGRERESCKRNWMTKKRRDNASKIDNAAGCKPLHPPSRSFSFPFSLALLSCFSLFLPSFSSTPRILATVSQPRGTCEIDSRLDILLKCEHKNRAVHAR